MDELHVAPKKPWDDSPYKYHQATVSFAPKKIWDDFLMIPPRNTVKQWFPMSSKWFFKWISSVATCKMERPQKVGSFPKRMWRGDGSCPPFHFAPISMTCKIQIVPPANIPIPTKMGSKMGGGFTNPNQNGIPFNGFDHHCHLGQGNSRGQFQGPEKQKEPWETPQETRKTRTKTKNKPVGHSQAQPFDFPTSKLLLF